MSWLNTVGTQGRTAQPGRRGASDPFRRTSRVPLPRVNPRGELGIPRVRCPVVTPSSASNTTFHGRLPRCVPCPTERACAVRAGHAPPARVPRRFGPRPCRLHRRAAPSRPAAAPSWPEGLAVSTDGPSASNGRACRSVRRPRRLDRRALPPGTARAAAWGVRCRRRFRRRGAAKGRLGHPKTPPVIHSSFQCIDSVLKFTACLMNYVFSSSG